MPISHEFDYEKPGSLKDVLDLKAKFKEKAWLLAGGTDLTVRLKEGEDAPEVLLDIKGIENYDKISVEKDFILLHAGVTFSDVIHSDELKEKLPLLWEASNTVASIGTRNRATVVGNICSAVPSLDSGPALLCYNAVVVLQSSTGTREINIEDWFTGPKRTAINPDEVVTGIKIPLPEKHGSCYVKLGRYRGEDLAQAGTGVVVYKDKTVRLAFCALGPVPKRAKSIEEALNGKGITNSLLDEVAALVSKEISPITDIRATKEYRLHIAEVMVKRGIQKALDRLNGEKLEIINVLG
jgi:carbon-monoxide dehydrogenase medium subunit